MSGAPHLKKPQSAARRRWLIAAAALALAPWFDAAGADRIAVRTAELQLIEDGNGSVALDALFAFDLPPVLEDAVNPGIALYFVVDFEMLKSR